MHLPTAIFATLGGAVAALAAPACDDAKRVQVIKYNDETLVSGNVQTLPLAEDVEIFFHVQGTPLPISAAMPVCEGASNCKTFAGVVQTDIADISLTHTAEPNRTVTSKGTLTVGIHRVIGFVNIPVVVYLEYSSDCLLTRSDINFYPGGSSDLDLVRPLLKYSASKDSLQTPCGRQHWDGERRWANMAIYA